MLEPNKIRPKYTRMGDGREDVFYYGKFPEGFNWSTATASYQIEGAWNKDGKGLNIWDTFSHTEGKVENGDTGDIACDSYHKYQEDIELLKNLGVDMYRFSLSWSRILPDGTKHSINQAGLDYYNALIDGLLAANIKPVITLYHWDLPQALHDKGGWESDEIIEYFNDYARICFDSFGDRVKMWITLNEPSVVVWNGYATGEHAPGTQDPLGATFRVAHSLIRSHARAYQTYDQEFRHKQKGQIGITLNSDWGEPKDPSNPEDQKASELNMQFKLGWYANPVYGDGDYPQLMKDVLAAVSNKLGMPKSALPEFTETEKKLNKGSADFFGLNHYSTRLCSMAADPGDLSPEDLVKLAEKNPGAIFGINEETHESWKVAGSSWLYVVPWGLRKLLCWINKQYGNPRVIITENGVSDRSGDINDQHRVDYLNGYINNVLKAVNLDGCNVFGYTVWSLMDNFEWARGYTERFGIHHVDYTDPERKRTPKASAALFSRIVKDNGFVKQ